MKKLLVIAGFAAMMLAACSSEDVVAPAKTDGGEGALMSFDISTKNISRGTTALAAEHHNFGVWAIKTNATVGLADAFGATPTNLVMNNYLVGTTYHYGIPAYETFGSVWYYEGLGYADSPIVTGDSRWEHQYLKYWDLSYTNTYFFAYAPYVKNVTGGTGAEGDPYTYSYATINYNATDGVSIVFPKRIACSTDSKDVPLIAATKKTNAHFAVSTNTVTSNPSNTPKVDLTFNRLMARVKVAVWNNIKGYDIELEDVTYNGETESAGGIILIPAKYDKNATPKYERGEFVYSAYAGVKFSESAGAGLVGTPYYTEVQSYGSAAGTNITLDKPTGIIGTTCNDRSYSPTEWNVLPTTKKDGTLLGGVELTAQSTSNQTYNDGFQVMMNFKLTAKDTGEVIHVKGARVYVDADYVEWEPNKLYTYIFRITRNTTGTTANTNPSSEPVEITEALYPIVFDSITIADLEAGEVVKEWVVNPEVNKDGADDEGHTPENAETTP